MIRNGRKREPDHAEQAKRFGMMVRQVRKRLGLKQSEFGGMMSVSTAAVSQWEMGRRFPTRPTKWLFEVLCAQQGIYFDEAGILTLESTIHYSIPFSITSASIEPR